MIRRPCFANHALMVKSKHVYCDQLCGYFDILGDGLILLISPVCSSSVPTRDGVNRNCITLSCMKRYIVPGASHLDQQSSSSSSSSYLKTLLGKSWRCAFTKASMKR